MVPVVPNAKEGDAVVAYTYASEEYDRPPQRVAGRLKIRRVPTLRYTQYLVDDTPVDPTTIARMNVHTTNVNLCHDESGRFCVSSSTVEDFHALADQQRDRPEHAMLQVQLAYGGGPLNPVVEHTGDLIHRMTEKNTFATAGYEYVKPKVEKLLSWMHREMYDWQHPGQLFDDEVRRSIGRNRDYYAETDPGKAMAYLTDVDDSLEKYATEHRKLKPLNEAQRHANQAAIAVGERRWGDAISHLRELEKHLGSRDKWIEYAHEGL